MSSEQRSPSIDEFWTHEWASEGYPALYFDAGSARLLVPIKQVKDLDISAKSDHFFTLQDELIGIADEISQSKNVMICARQSDILITAERLDRIGKDGLSIPKDRVFDLPRPPSPGQTLQTTFLVWVEPQRALGTPRLAQVTFAG
jgi:hypothetical protein